jgi:hypothetical protein
VRSASSILQALGLLAGGAMLVLIYLKRVVGIEGLQDLQDGMFLIVIVTIGVRFFVDRKSEISTNG